MNPDVNPDVNPPAQDLETVAAHRFVSLTTFRRSGVAVSSPVWVARDGAELVVVTVDGTGKTKRLAHTARVELRPCDMRGAVPEGAPVSHGTARVVRSADEVAAVKTAIRRTYLLARLGDLITGVTSRLRHGKPRAGIRILLD